MSILGVLAILIVVIIVAVVRPVSLQATLYSLPLPLTVGLASLSGVVSPMQPLSAFGAVGFFYLASWLRDVTRRRYVASIGAGLVVFLAIVALNRVPTIGVWPPIIIAFAAWIPIGILALRALRNSSDETNTEGVRWRNVAAALPMFVIASVAAPLAGSLGAMFPFAGLAVSTAISGRLWSFAHNFALRAIGLIGFCATYSVSVNEYRVSTWPALGLSWASYIILLLAALGLRCLVAARAGSTSR